MNALNDLYPRNQARAFSARFGELAASAPTTSQPVDPNSPASSEVDPIV
jgi:hypothetical protein